MAYRGIVSIERDHVRERLNLLIAFLFLVACIQEDH